MRYRCYLDNVLVDEPLGLDDIEITIERSRDIRGLLVLFTSELRFVGTGYDALKTKRDTGGITSLTDVLIQYDDGDGWLDLFEGIIFTSDISFNLMRKEATATVEDNSFSALINNNKNIKASFDIGKSKNDTTITAVTTVDIDFYDPNDAIGTYLYPDLKCYRVYDCFRFIIDFMTDGRVDFDSDFFDTGGDGEGYMITTGKILSGTDDDDYLYNSFFDLFTNLDKRFNLSFKVDTSGTSPKVVIEPENDLFEEVDGVTFDSPRDVLQEFDKSRLYSKLQFGNQTYTSYNTLDDADYPSISFFSHQQEEFHVLGDGNLDNELDLLGDWSVDSNSIQQAVIGTTGTTTSTSSGKLVDSGGAFTNGDVVVGIKVYNLTDGTSTTIDAIDSATQLDLADDIFTSGEDYKIATRTNFDDSIFIVQTDYPTNDRATKNDDFEPALGVYLYNVLLNNYNVSVNYFAGVPNSIAAFLQGDTENAKAAITSSSGLTVSGPGHIIFNDDSVNGYNTGGNYSTANGRYTVPVGGSGAYTVGCIFDWYVPFPPGTGELGKVYLRQYNSGGTLLREDQIATITTLGNLFSWAGSTRTFYANDGDYFRVEYDRTGLVANWVITQEYTLGVIQSYSAFFVYQVGTADIAQTYNPEDFRGFLYKFDYPISQGDWETINDNLSYRISLTLTDETKKGWIEKIVYRHKRKTASIILIGTD